MRIIVADTTPIRYLAEIGHLDLLPRLFETIYIPSVVYAELQQSATPPDVSNQLAPPPSWLKIVSPQNVDTDPVFLVLDEGERSALSLGVQLRADLILIDERRGAAIARQKGLQITGTLGILVRAARRNMVALADAIARLRKTTFRCSEELLTALLAEHD